MIFLICSFSLDDLHKVINSFFIYLLSFHQNHNTPIRYEITDFITRDSPVSLNQNHTHYIFVDEGRRLRYGGSKSAEFRARLEKQIALPVKSK